MNRAKSSNPAKKKLKTSRKESKKHKQNFNSQLDAEIAGLERRIQEGAPPPGTNPLAFDAFKKKDDESGKEEGKSSKEPLVQYSAARKFSELPLSRRTLSALSEAKFTRMTDIQRAALPHALAGRDVLGAAKTGSGKTLAFMIPVVEKLFRLKWTPLDGLGALVISPTRELAIQIFDVLRQVGNRHEMSAGLVIGGKAFEDEQKHILGMNILVATPGRLLQHMDQTPGFNCDNLQVLVLDEADRILDMGFEKTITAIVQNLPPTRQTLLFSATQTTSVRSLARLSLQQPEYLAVHSTAEVATPAKLVQTYLVCEAHQKFDMLYSFIKTHLRSKCIVFVSSCKQVRFLFEMFRRLHPGVPLTHMHGKMKQDRRMSIYYDFLQRKEVVLFATDLAARGLDFPRVDWVVQFDCPENVETYIHRAGRTARYKSAGNGLLLLLPSEIKFVDHLKEAKIPLKQAKANPEKLKNISQQFQSFLAEDPDLKYLAQRAFISYLRSIFLQADKEVFDVLKIDANKLSEGMGLPLTPKIKFIKGSAHAMKNLPAQVRELVEEEKLKEAAKQGDEKAAQQLREREKKKKRKALEEDQHMRNIDKLLRRQNTTIYNEARLKLRADGEEEEDEDEEEEGEDDSDVAGGSSDSEQDSEAESDEESDSEEDEEEKKEKKEKSKSKKKEEDDDLFVIKRRDHDIQETEEDQRALMAKMSRKRRAALRRGEVVDEDQSDFEVEEVEGVGAEVVEKKSQHLQRVKTKMVKADVVDKQRDRERVQALHLQKRLAERELNRSQQEAVAVLGGDEEDGDEVEDQEPFDNDDDDDDNVSIDLNEDDEPSVPAPRSSAASKKRKIQAVRDDSEDNDEDGDDDEEEGDNDAGGVKSVEEAEQLALSLLRARK